MSFYLFIYLFRAGNVTGKKRGVIWFMKSIQILQNRLQISFHVEETGRNENEGKLLYV